MNNQHKFKEEEIPYGILEKFGLTREMIGDLPQSVLQQVCDGYRSPVLPIHITDEGGNIIQGRTRFALVRTETREADILFYPVLAQSRLEQFSEANRQKLAAGKAVMAAMTDADGRQVQAFHQIDEGTGQILSVPTHVIGRNLQYFCDYFELSNAELNCLQNGEPLTLVDEGSMLTLGIDLHDPTGIRIGIGDERQWREQNKKGLKKYNFGCFGCWVMDEQGNLDYVEEKEYSEEMWEEMKKNRAGKLKMKN